MRAREEKSSRYFADDSGTGGGGVASDPFESIELTSSNSNNGRINTQELLLLEDNSKFVQEREKEINVIVKSIVELNTIFKDLAHMVTEQVRATRSNHKLLDLTSGVLESCNEFDQSGPRARNKITMLLLLT